jgi:hypothetical protein
MIQPDPAPGVGDGVVGIFTRADLSSALVATHRAGFGPHARVLDPTRGDLAGQMRRAGFALPLEPAAGDPSSALLLVVSPGRAAAIVELFTRAGARAIHILTRSPAPSTVVDIPLSFGEAGLSARDSRH